MEEVCAQRVGIPHGQLSRTLRGEGFGADASVLGAEDSETSDVTRGEGRLLGESRFGRRSARHSVGSKRREEREGRKTHSQLLLQLFLRGIPRLDSHLPRQRERSMRLPRREFAQDRLLLLDGRGALQSIEDLVRLFFLCSREMKEVSERGEEEEGKRNEPNEGDGEAVGAAPTRWTQSWRSSMISSHSLDVFSISSARRAWAFARPFCSWVAEVGARGNRGGAEVRRGERKSVSAAPSSPSTPHPLDSKRSTETHHPLLLPRPLLFLIPSPMSPTLAQVDKPTRENLLHDDIE